MACMAVAVGMVMAFSGCGGGGGGGGGTAGPDLGAPLVGAWQAQEAEIDGEPASLSQAMGLDPLADNVVSVFWNNGSRTTYVYAGDTPVASESATWTVSGSVVTVSTTGSSRNYECAVSETDLCMNSVRHGHAVRVRWQKVQEGAGVGTGGAESGTAVGPMIMGAWEAVSVTVNGETAPIAEALDCSPPVDGIVLMFHGYGTLTAYVYIGSTILETRDAMWAASDTTMTIYWSNHIATFDCSLTGSQLTLAHDNAGDSIVLVCRKMD